MDILIKNIAMPKGDIPLVLIIASDGTVEEIDDSDEINATDAKAIEISPHGKLCEKEAVWDMRYLLSWRQVHEIFQRRNCHGYLR